MLQDFPLSLCSCFFLGGRGGGRTDARERERENAQMCVLCVLMCRGARSLAVQLVRLPARVVAPEKARLLAVGSRQLQAGNKIGRVRSLPLSPSLSLGRAQPSDGVGGRNINSNSCFLTPAVSLPEHTFLESPIRGNKRGSFRVRERETGWAPPGAAAPKATQEALLARHRLPRLSLLCAGLERSNLKAPSSAPLPAASPSSPLPTHALAHSLTHTHRQS